MKNFKIAHPKTLAQAASLLSDTRKNCFFAAGGTDLLGEIKDEIVEPDVVVDLPSIPGLSSIKSDKDSVWVGALTSVADLAGNELIKQKYPVLHEAAGSVGTPQLRRMGTLGGNLCQRPRCWYYRDSQILCRKKGGSICFALRGRNKYHAILGGGPCYIVHPSDLAPALVSLGAEIAIYSPEGEKTLPLADFFVLPRENVRRENILGPRELVKEVRIPAPQANDKSTYVKLKERAVWDFALVSAAVWGRISGNVFEDLRIVLGGVAPVPWRLKTAEDLIRGNKVTDSLLKQAAKEAIADARPLKENDYKTQLVEAALLRSVPSLV